MDYKKAYHRARMIAESRMSCEENESVVTFIGLMFPELRESEDERIRKHLIEVVELYWGKTNEPGKAEDLAWLEKQKEQKPAEWSEEDEKIAYTILNLLCSQVTYVTGQGTTSGKQFPTYAKERDWFEKRFKSLRPQPKQERSEEDEQ